MRISPNKRLALIVPYVGHWPKWATLFFESCRLNPQLDVLIICVERPPFDLPDNVRVLDMTFPDLVNRLESVTGLCLESVSGHKLCDFRPFYGLAFSDILQPYEFWGYCDIDMMFGDLSRLLSDQYLNSIDAFSAHANQFVGHFTIIRNCEVMNRACFQIKDWQKLCLTERAEHVDEERFSEAISEDPAIRWRRPEPLKLELEKEFASHGVTFSFFGKIPELEKSAVPLVEWREGTVFFHGEDGRVTPVLYVHFMATKHWWHWLFWNDDSATQTRHYFSRIGYGGPKTAKAIRRIHWSCLYAFQVGLLHCKRAAGALLRKLLPAPTFSLVGKKISSLIR